MANFCTQCGRPIDPRIGFCPQCEPERMERLLDQLDQPQQSSEWGPGYAPPPQEPRRSASFGMVLLIILLILLVLLTAAGVGAFLYFRSLEAEDPFPSAPSIQSPSIQSPSIQSPNVQSPTAAPTCQHNWTPATCEDPQVCTLCGQAQGSPLGHQWEPATFTAPKTCRVCGKTEGESTGKIGDTIYFGHYEQDNNFQNGSEPIQWTVLDASGNHVMLISTKALDSQPYNLSQTDVTWETCTIRHWLNNVFYYAAFDETEQRQILETSVSTEANSLYSTDPGKGTSDKVFFLSLQEAERYFRYDSERLAPVTEYAAAQGAYSDSGYGWWLMRTPGDTQDKVCSTFTAGGIDYDGGSVSSKRGCVRPVIWVDLG